MESRRLFLSTLSVIACGACSSSTHSGTPASGPIPGGNVKDVPVGTLKAVLGQPVILARDAGGLYAMTAICTHSQCDITEDGTIGPTTIRCDCHGSRFDANGAVQVGPAAAPLAHYQVDLAADGAITVQASQPAASTARTPVPTT